VNGSFAKYSKYGPITLSDSYGATERTEWKLELRSDSASTKLANLQNFEYKSAIMNSRFGTISTKVERANLSKGDSLGVDLKSSRKASGRADHTFFSQRRSSRFNASNKAQPKSARFHP